MEKETTDSDRGKAAIDREERRKERLSKINAEKSLTKKAACECFSAPGGSRTLLWLMRECGYQQPSTIVDLETGEVKKDATVYNEARRAIYLELRAMLSSKPELLIDVEIHQLKGE